jgi:hypothetical protein
VNFLRKKHIFYSPYVLIQICQITRKCHNFNPGKSFFVHRVNKILLDTENMDHKDNKKNKVLTYSTIVTHIPANTPANTIKIAPLCKHHLIILRILSIRCPGNTIKIAPLCKYHLVILRIISIRCPGNTIKISPLCKHHLVILRILSIRCPGNTIKIAPLFKHHVVILRILSIRCPGNTIKSPLCVSIIS